MGRQTEIPLYHLERKPFCLKIGLQLPCFTLTGMAMDHHTVSLMGKMHSKSPADTLCASTDQYDLSLNHSLSTIPGLLPIGNRGSIFEHEGAKRQARTRIPNR